MRVELREIYKYFGPVRANDGISLCVEPGTIHGLLGENGAGKSTLMKVLSGYLAADWGEILLDDQPVHFSSPAQAIARGVGMLHQDPLDFPALTVLDNFLLGSPGALFPRRARAR
ncbi:MAG: ATP-binding cassette domain-containing protein, partial [Chloroflexia bacterium]